MKPLLRLALAVTIVAAFATTLWGQSPVKRALLVGCTTYDNLDSQYYLEGPANDVLLMRDVLKKYYDFKDNNVVILSEAEGKQRGKDYRPTRANIQREFERLAQQAHRGDKVVILLGGHGSQEPDSRPDDPERYKPDGKEEIFLPADCGKWGGTRVEGAIADYEFKKWWQDIRKTGASIWIIVDACHSASMVRGNEIAREVPADKLVPEEKLREAAAKARVKQTERGRGSRPQDTTFKVVPDEPDLVAIYAAQRTEPTVELILPEEGQSRKPQGLLTYTLCNTLIEAAKAKRSLTYRELLRGVLNKYRSWDRKYPTPSIEGKDSDRTILGDEVRPTQTLIHLRTKDDNWVIDAGALHGLTVGSILDVRPPATEAGADTPAGYVKILPQGFGPLEARVEPCAYKGLPPPRDPPKDARCQVVLANFGSQRLGVAVDDHTNKVIDQKTGAREPVPKVRRRLLQQALEELARGDESLVEVATPATAKWLLRLDSLASDKLFLVPASGWLLPGAQNKPTTEGSLQELPTLFGSAPEGDRRLPWLKTSLTRIARVRNLLSVASEVQPYSQSDQGSPLGVKVRVELRRLRDKFDRVGEKLEPGPEGIVIRDGDWIGFNVINDGRDAVDVNLLLVDSEYGIDAVWPKRPSIDNRLQGGKRLPFRLKAGATTSGLEHLLLIAVNAKDVAENAYFGFLAQPSIDKASRDVNTLSRGAQQRGFGSPVGQLLRKAVYGEGATRGLEPDEVAEYAFQTVSYNMLAGKRPAGGR
jgi:hypothetical protein